MNLIMYRMLLLLLYLTYYPVPLVTSQAIAIILKPPVNQSVCVGGTVNFTCVVMFTSGTPSAASWITDLGTTDAAALPGNTRTDDSNERSAPANVTTLLTVTNVSISDNGTDYLCAQGLNPISNRVFLTVFGPPGNVTDLNISTITACSMVVQWSRPSSDPVCGTVWYTVTISSEGGVMIINTTMTSYDVTGLNDNTVYHVSVTASNNAGSSSSVTMITMTNSVGLPSSQPNITAITTLNDTSFIVNWTTSDASYKHIVILINLDTSVIDNFTVSENTNSYTVTGLSEYNNYNVCVAIVGCKMETSGYITVYGPPTPEFDYCVSYTDGQPALQVISYVTVTTPRTSLSLTFSASHQTGNSSSQSAMCSSLSDDMQYNCTAEFAVDINPSVDAIESVIVTVSGQYGSASSLKNISQSVEIFGVDFTSVTDSSVTLSCQLPCFSPDLQCVLYKLTTNDMDINATNDTSNITGSVESYSYPTQAMIISGLDSGTTYSYCVILYNITDMMEVGEPVCGNFTTIGNCDGCCGECCGSCCGILCIIIAIIAAVMVCIVLLIPVFLYWYCKRKKFSKVDEAMPPNVQLRDNSQGDKPLGDNITYGISSHDDKHTTTETRMQDDCSGTIRDDWNSSVPPNNVSSKDWYDKLAADDKKSDDEHPVTNEREHVSEHIQQQELNDTARPHPFFEATEASRQQQQSPVNTVNNNEVFARNSEESTATATVPLNNNAANKQPLAPINLYDPIQQHPPIVPHLHTSSGEKYALPSPKLGRANKHANNATAVNKPMPQYSVPDKSKKTANKKNKHSELDVPSPTADDTTPLTYQKTKDMVVESSSSPPAEDPHP